MQRSSPPSLMVVDDDPDLLNLLEFHFDSWGYDVFCARDRQEMFAQLAETNVDLIILDLHLGDDDGIDVCVELSKQPCGPPVIVLTAYGTIRSAVEATRMGVFDYLTKPPDLERLKSLADRAVNSHRFDGGSPASTDEGQDAATVQMIGNSPAMQRVRRMISDVAPTDAKVLLLGETGTGKDLVARAIHQQSPRAGEAFVPVNMAALPRELAESLLFGHEKGAYSGADVSRKGWCETANNGTLFLDEIGEMDLSLQAKLLRFLQDNTFQRVGSSQPRSVDVRILSATNGNPEDLVREGRLREDLYHRLNVIPIVVPPLRERPSDVTLLANWFLKRTAERANKQLIGFADEVLEIFQHYEWPGNVRELENLVQRLVILARGPVIGVGAIPPSLREGAEQTPSSAATERPPHDEEDGLRMIDRIEKQAIVEALIKSDGNVVAAARLLGVGQATVYRKIKRYGINPKRMRVRAVEAEKQLY